MYSVTHYSVTYSVHFIYKLTHLHLTMSKTHFDPKIHTKLFFENLSKKHNKNKTYMANELDISRPALYRWIDKANGKLKNKNIVQNNLDNVNIRNIKKNNNIVDINEFKLTEGSKLWLEEAEKYNFTVYTLNIEGSIYVGYTGDLKARIYQHKQQFWAKQNKFFEIISCEFFLEKLDAIDKEWQLICHYKLNNFQLENKKISKPQYSLDFLNSDFREKNCNPQIPMPGEYNNSITWFPSYKGFIDWCKDNPHLPFAETLYDNCEGKTRKHWRSATKSVFELLKAYMDEN